MSRLQAGESGVYKITNLINLKGYVGITKNIHCRWQEHKKASLKDTKPLYKAMRKYGIDNFKFEVLCLVSTNDPEILFELEIFFIADQNTFIDDGWGYNLNRGGGGNIFPSQSTIAKMSAFRSEWNTRHGANFKGCQHTDKWKEEAGQRMLGNSYSLGRKHTTSAKEKLSEIRTGQNNPCFGKHPYHLPGNLKVSFFKSSPGEPWIIGYPTVECPHCGDKGPLQVMQRSHFDKCRFKGQSLLYF
jgi:group I intron endonuclease